MDQSHQTASAYYDKGRKRSFLLSRIMVVTAMVVLVVTLGINVAVLSSPEKSTIQSQAYTPENPVKNLPVLPKGCYYQQQKGNTVVVCPTPEPTVTNSVPLTIALPPLPQQCNFVITDKGTAIQCSVSPSPMPTVAVPLPANCSATNHADLILCQLSDKQTTPVKLPPLPIGCSYEENANKYFVVCEIK